MSQEELEAQAQDLINQALEEIKEKEEKINKKPSKNIITEEDLDNDKKEEKFQKQELN